MHAEKLHELAIDLLQEERNLGIGNKFTALLQAVAVYLGLPPSAAESSTPSPDEPNPSESGIKQVAAIDKARRNLLLTLSAAWTNEMVPSDMLMLQTVGGDRWTGIRLRQRIEALFDLDDLSLHGTHDELVELHDGFSSFYGAVERLAEGMKRLGVGRDHLPGDIAEGGAIFPIPEKGMTLEDVRKEVAELDKHLRPLLEISGEGAGSLEIRAIATTDLKLFMALPMGAAWCFSKICKWLADGMEHLVRFKRAFKELVDAGIDEETRDRTLDAYMERQVEEITEELVETYEKADEGRKNELRQLVRRVVLYMARKAQEGAIFEVKGFAAGEEAPTDDLPPIEGFTFQKLKEQGAAMARIAALEERMLMMEHRELLTAGQAGDGPEVPGEGGAVEPTTPPATDG